MARLSSRAASERSDLSVPKGAPVRGSLYDADAFGRFSEGLARFLGTGRYLFGQTGFVIGRKNANCVFCPIRGENQVLFFRN